MATTITIQQSINYSKAYCGWRPLNIGANNEPAITAANLVLQTVIGPPFGWNWNRGSINFTTTLGTQDYAQNTPAFGFIERGDYKIPSAPITNTVLLNGTATYTAANNFQANDLVTVTGTTNGSGVFNVANTAIVSATGSQFTLNINGANVGSATDTGTAVVGTATEITQITNLLGVGSDLGSPANIAPQIDDNAGSITFRLLPVPDRVYSVGVTYQQRIPQLITSLSQTWAPIPDHYSFIYQDGFLALMLAYQGDPRSEMYNQKFIGKILGTSEGLSEEERSQFYQTWQMQNNMMQAQGLRVTQAAQGRGSE